MVPGIRLLKNKIITNSMFSECSDPKFKSSNFIIMICVCVCALSHFRCVQLFATLWTVAQQAPLSMGFSRQEYWSGLSCLPPGDLPNPGSETMSLTPPALAGRLFTTSATWEAQQFLISQIGKAAL